MDAEGCFLWFFLTLGNLRLGSLFLLKNASLDDGEVNIIRNLSIRMQSLNERKVLVEHGSISIDLSIFTLFLLLNGGYFLSTTFDPLVH